MGHQINIDLNELNPAQREKLFSWLDGKSTNEKVDKKIKEEKKKAEDKPKKKKKGKGKKTADASAVRKLLKKYRDIVGKPESKKLMKRYNAATVNDLDEKSYEEIVIEMNQAIAEAEAEDEPEDEEDEEDWEDED